MLKSITKRDIKFFVFGILFLILIDIILNLSGAKQSFLAGFNSNK
jgi:hypothetical protein